MTKTRKPAAITFSLIAGTKIRRNAETGVEIHAAKLDIGGTEYSIYRTSRDGSLSYWGSESTLKGARELASERVEMIRDEVADAQLEAFAMDVAETERVLAALRVEIDRTAEDAGPWSNKVFATVIGAARGSVRHGFVQPARDRVARAQRILTGAETVPTDAEAAEDLAAAQAKFTIGALVRTPRGLARVERAAYLSAEQGRVVVPVRFVERGYGSVWADAIGVEVA
jgi:hypothetical protein